MNFSEWQLRALDLGLMSLHLLVIAINVFGWILPSTRRLQRWVLSLTSLSWLGLGAWMGWGYCFLTDWHWDIKRALGEGPLPASYIQYILRHHLGLHVPDRWVDAATAAVFGLLVLITLLQLWQERRSPSAAARERS
jgi:hypothetical protein